MPARAAEIQDRHDSPNASQPLCGSANPCNSGAQKTLDVFINRQRPQQERTPLSSSRQNCADAGSPVSPLKNIWTNWRSSSVQQSGPVPKRRKTNEDVSKAAKRTPIVAPNVRNHLITSFMHKVGDRICAQTPPQKSRPIRSGVSELDVLERRINIGLPRANVISLIAEQREDRRKSRSDKKTEIGTEGHCPNSQVPSSSKVDTTSSSAQNDSGDCIIVDPPPSSLRRKTLSKVAKSEPPDDKVPPGVAPPKRSIPVRISDNLLLSDDDTAPEEEIEASGFAGRNGSRSLSRTSDRTANGSVERGEGRSERSEEKMREEEDDSSFISSDFVRMGIEGKDYIARQAMELERAKRKKKCELNKNHRASLKGKNAKDDDEEDESDNETEEKNGEQRRKKEREPITTTRICRAAAAQAIVKLGSDATKKPPNGNAKKKTEEAKTSKKKNDIAKEDGDKQKESSAGSGEKLGWFLEKDKRKNIEDLKIDEQVYTRENEGVDIWDKYSEECEKKGTGWEFDYVLGENTKGNKILVKWTNFPVPTWISADGVETKRCEAYVAHEKRKKILVGMEKRLREELREAGEDFDDVYPNRNLIYQKGIGEHGYITEKHALYYNRLRAWEWRINYECARSNLPPLYVESWCDDGEENIPDLTFTNYMIPSPNVQKVLDITKELADIKCTDCKTTCPYPRENFHILPNCCGVKFGSVVNYSSNLLACRIQDDEKEQEPAVLSIMEIDDIVVVECTDACGCDVDYCKQRVVQRGRRMPLIIFNERGKGWGVRAPEEIKEGQFVSEYIGEVVTGYEARQRGGMYSFDMRFVWKDAKGRKHRQFTVDAAKMGNEGRFFNHSCSPNMAAFPVWIERHGEFYHRIAFFARRTIPIGEELTFDYFPNFNPDQRNFIPMFEPCRCGSERCKLPEKRQRTETDDSDTDGDDDADVDSIADAVERQMRITQGFEDAPDGSNIESQPPISAKKRERSAMAGRHSLSRQSQNKTISISSDDDDESESDEDVEDEVEHDPYNPGDPDEIERKRYSMYTERKSRAEKPGGFRAVLEKMGLM